MKEEQTHRHMYRKAGVKWAVHALTEPYQLTDNQGPQQCIVCSRWRGLVSIGGLWKEAVNTNKHVHTDTQIKGILS